MIKASALYIVIIMALVIALLCSSLIVAAYFYRAQYQQKFRYDQLANNVNSGITILLGTKDSVYSNGKTLSLFGGDADSEQRISVLRIVGGEMKPGAQIQCAIVSNIFIFSPKLFFYFFVLSNIILIC